MEGFFNRLLIIELGEQCFTYEHIPDAVLAETLGGKGLGTHLLTKENPQGVDPLSGDNVFVVATGPVTGTRMWGRSRFGVYSKSPATGGYGESYCGGTLAPKIKGCGVDAVVVRGRCDALTFLVIDEAGVSFRDASEMKGQDTVQSERYILKHSPEGAGAMVIGPAGENRVAFACIKSDRWRSLGRGGMGAVLGAKNLKGISFFGAQECPIAHETLLKEIARRIAAQGKNSPGTRRYQELGTAMMVEVTNAANCFPTRYWSSGHFSSWERLSAEYRQEHFGVSSHACPPCFLRCTKRSRVLEGRHKGLELEGPEYETIYAIGGLNAIDSLEEVAWLNDVCDRLGLDTISAGNMSAFAVEAFRRGKSDYQIGYNQPDRAADLYGLIAQGAGMGAVLGKGIRYASKELDMEDAAIHVKGQEPAGFDPRVLKGMGLSYATASRGACHLRGTFYKAELSGEIDEDQISGKAKLLIDYEDRAALFDSLILCRFFRDLVLWDELGGLIEATTGMRPDRAQLEVLANRITNRTRQYNRREGLDSSTDTLPKRFLTEATEEGAVLTAEELETMVGEYNAIRGSR